MPAAHGETVDANRPRMTQAAGRLPLRPEARTITKRMLTKPNEPGLTFPFPAPPEPGRPVEVAPGVLWVRLSLPFQLNHVNVYLIDDGDGFAILDTGIGTARTRADWEALLAGPLGGRQPTRLIVSHFHPDHVGAAGWLAERFGLPLYMSQTDYLLALNIYLDPGALDAKPYRDFYLKHGLDEVTTNLVVTQGHGYLKMMTGLPSVFRRLIAGDTLKVGDRRLDVMTGGGHAAEQVMLFSQAENVFFAADQVMARISPNVSVWAVDPEGDPLGIYLRSLASLAAAIPADALVLPGHNLPFHGLHVRIGELAAHHATRCDMIAAASRGEPRSTAELVPVLFPRALDPQQMSFAFSEVLAHVNYMLRRDELAWADSRDGIKRVLAR